MRARRYGIFLYTRYPIVARRAWQRYLAYKYILYYINTNARARLTEYYIQDTQSSSRALSLAAALRPSARANKGILHTRQTKSMYLIKHINDETESSHIINVYRRAN